MEASHKGSLTKANIFYNGAIRLKRQIVNDQFA